MNAKVAEIETVPAQPAGAAGTGNGGTGNGAAPRALRGQWTLYHANGKATGTAICLELRLNRAGEDHYDCFFLEMARQKTAAANGETERKPATFDWAGKATVKLDFADVCELLAVLEGKQAQAGGERNGLYHTAGGANTLIGFWKNREQPGYGLSLSRKDREGQQVFKGLMTLSETEAIGLRCLLQSSLFFMTFHRNLRS